MTTAADGSPFTGAVTILVTGDRGTQATGSVGAGACAHEGNGFHTYAPAQAETNYDHIGFTFTGTGAISVTVQVFTVAGDAFTRLGAPAGASVAADIAAIKAETATILSDTNDIQSRLPAALVSGRMDASVGAMASNVMTAAAAAADLTTELQAGLATQASVDAVDDFLDTEVAAILAAVDTEVAAIKAKTDQLTFTTANQVDARAIAVDDKTGYAIGVGGIGATAFAAGAINAAALASDAVDEILDETIGDGTITLRQAAKLMVAALGGKVSGGGTATVTIRNVADTADIVVASVDGAGNRTSVTVNL